MLLANVLHKTHFIRRCIPGFNNSLTIRFTSTKDSGNDDFFTSFKKRVEEEAKKENVDISSLKNDSTLLKLKSDLKRIGEVTVNFISNAADTVSTASSKFSSKTKNSFEALNASLNKSDNRVVAAAFCMADFYRENVKNKVKPINRNTRSYKLMNTLYNETFGMYFNNVPTPFIDGKSKELKIWTDQLMLKKHETSTVTRIVPVQRRYLKWFIHDYLMDIPWINRTVYYVSTDQNVLLTRFLTGYRQSRDSFKYLMINKEYIETNKNLILFHNNFLKEDFLFKWENKVIPGVLEALLVTKDFELLKNWMTPECYLLISSSNDFFASVKTQPIIVDIYDTDIFNMKRMEKSSSSLLFLRFNVIYTYKEIGDAYTGKKVKFEEGVINWAIQTDPSYRNNDLGFKVADLGNTVAKLYGFEK